MKKFKIVPLTEAYAQKIRSSRVDDFGHEVIEKVASEAGPCRLSLKPFEVGVDKRLLFAYSPFEKENAFNQSGPVFIHSKAVEPYADIHRFPPELKADKVNFPLTLIGYNADQQMALTKLVGDADVDDLITKIYEEQPDVAYLHARNAEASCFICKIERIEQE